MKMTCQACGVFVTGICVVSEMLYLIRSLLSINSEDAMQVMFLFPIEYVLFTTVVNMLNKIYCAGPGAGSVTFL